MTTIFADLIGQISAHEKVALLCAALGGASGKIIGMTPEEAGQCLLIHSYMYTEDIHHPKMDSGFLGLLRPYKGKLNEDNYHEVMEAIRVLAPQFNQEKVDRNLISCIWQMCSFARQLGRASRRYAAEKQSYYD